jgi:hypothetical protein
LKKRRETEKQEGKWKGVVTIYVRKEQEFFSLVSKVPRQCPSSFWWKYVSERVKLREVIR